VLTLFTVDARGGSDGMRLGEIAELLQRDYGVWDAINLDGGGSTTMAWENPETGVTALVNTSSDNPDGRAVASSLAVFARRRCRSRERDALFYFTVPKTNPIERSTGL
jgi:exopolysaccharide biosynthesis protein